MTEALDRTGPHGDPGQLHRSRVIESEMTEGILKDPKQAEALLARAPLKRAGKAEEIAAAVVYFASEESSYTTGSILYVDGGWLAN